MDYKFADIDDLKNNIVPMIKKIPKREYKGKGIVTASGDLERLRQSFTSIKMLRSLGCKLPIEMFYADSSEISSSEASIFEKFDVKCINVQDNNLFATYNARNFTIKALALYLSSFDEMLWLDTDIIPLINLSEVFKFKAYLDSGYFFYSDIWYRRDPNFCCKGCNTMNEKSNTKIELENTLGIKSYIGEPETEAGFYIVNKKRCTHDWIHLVLLLNINSHITYKYVYGDKDLFGIAMKMLKIEYSTIDEYPRAIGKRIQKKRSVFGAVMLHYRGEAFAIHMTILSIDYRDKIKFMHELWDVYTTNAFRLVSTRVGFDECPQFVLMTNIDEYADKWILPLSDDLKHTQKQMYKYYEESKTILLRN